MEKYGKPKGRGILGRVVFLPGIERGALKGIRLYAQRCRNGRYTIIYSDDGAMMQAAPEESKKEMNGL